MAKQTKADLLTEIQTLKNKLFKADERHKAGQELGRRLLATCEYVRRYFSSHDADRLRDLMDLAGLSDFFVEKKQAEDNEADGPMSTFKFKLSNVNFGGVPTVAETNVR